MFRNAWRPLTVLILSIALTPVVLIGVQRSTLAKPGSDLVPERAQSSQVVSPDESSTTSVPPVTEPIPEPEPTTQPVQTITTMTAAAARPPQTRPSRNAPASPPPSPSAQPSVTPEMMANGLFLALNQQRRANGLPPMVWDGDLAAAARQWSNNMSASRSLVHSDLRRLFSGRLAVMRSFGENIGKGAATISAASLHQVWMSSPPHRKNILSPTFNRVGIGVTRGSDGNIYVTQEFAQSP